MIARRQSTTTSASWYWAEVVLMTVQKGQRRNPNAMTEIWLNLLIVKATNPSAAYDKASAIGRKSEGDDNGSLTLWGRPALTKFIGISGLGEIHDGITDGSEITWRLRRRRLRNVRSIPEPKKVLTRTETAVGR